MASVQLIQKRLQTIRDVVFRVALNAITRLNAEAFGATGIVPKGDERRKPFFRFLGSRNRAGRGRKALRNGKDEVFVADDFGKRPAKGKIL